MLDRTRQDARFAGRALGRSPVFTLTALLSLAIGIGATTAIVTLADALLQRTPPGIGAPDRVVTIGRTQDGSGFDTFSYPNFLDLRASARSFSGMAAMHLEPRPVSLAGPGGGEAAQAGIVGASFFDVLQARPGVGRLFRRDEDASAAASPVVVLSHRFWRDRFAGDSGVVGRLITLNGSGFTVVGVASEGFQGPFVLAPDLWVPIPNAAMLGLPRGLLESREAVWLVAIARLAPDVPMSAAQAELTGIGQRLATAFPDANRGRGFRVMRSSPIPGDMGGVVGRFMSVLLAVAGLVLLIAGTNVAGMMLARAATRRREIAVRLALGATRGRLVMHLVMEGLLIAVAAGALGLVIAQWLVAGLMSLVPRLPVQLHVQTSLDWRVLTFALVVAAGSGLLASLLPALRSSRPALVPALKSDTAGGGHRLRVRNGLLVAQLALSMLLLVSAGLFARALVEARAIDPGFDPENIHVASLDLQLANLESARGLGLADALVERTRQLPGAERAALSAMLPLDGGGLGLGPIEVAGATPPNAERGWEVDWNVVTPGYFEVLRIPLVRGRDFGASDREGAPRVAIINETFAKRLWPGGDAIGRTFVNDSQVVTVVGVARDAKYRTLGEPPRNFVYVPLAQRYFTRLSLLVRTAPGAPVTAPVRRLVGELAPALPVLDQRTMIEQTALSLFPQRVALWVAGSLGGVALLLALLGIYGVTAYGVTQRTREIGIRVALGAQRARVLGLVLRQGLSLAGAGVAIGALGAVGVTRLLRGLLYGVPPTDVVAFGAAAALLVAAAMLASWVPARRAAAVEPVSALRVE